ncbi:Pyruvate dehydrogenase E1 subunit alpha [Candidatus Cyrtobacter comes]|uniref:Pyruvate dehydrogenase E1 component subunit alpha n=2 Tax=Candidatus Cyrtobacter comes TaxID=675776 RepID=A0ABU5L841_9RICK|nr:Pyruvate dehydrogenase E1 subunit alpha [Candidatus Cyrtobacter comes]
MLLLRRFEERSGQLYGMKLIGGFCHLYIGQEAVAVGIQSTLKAGDKVITSYRDHGPMLATGSCPDAIMAELFGKFGGCSKGKGGSMHMFDLEKGFYGGHGIVGAQVPLGTGIAFAEKYKGTDNVCVTMFGDGAANQGQVYESFNMAKLWSLPVIYVIENNEYAMGTAVSRSCSTVDLYKRGESFGIEGQQVDGMDFFAVHSAMSKTVECVRNGSGPKLLEIKTYRYRGHSMSDPGTYRDKDEVNSYRNERDPIEIMKSKLMEMGLLDDIKVKEIEQEIKQIVEKATNFAKESPEPPMEELYTDIFKNNNINV